MPVRPGRPDQVEKERYNGICQLAEPKKKDAMGMLSWPSRKKRYNDIAEPAKNKNSSGRRLNTVFPLYGGFAEKYTMGLASWPSPKKDTMRMAAGWIFELSLCVFRPKNTTLSNLVGNRMPCLVVDAALVLTLRGGVICRSSLQAVRESYYD